ncbi:MAG: hypothetical protein B6A08_14940 [Sorangiineae bacterium NIC37A_2]|jgi:hypothetical protein|nr:MAG: hypothetical protein B6A08_14940 [Sorangiineae bacterium NIC37A_2]
MAKAHESWTVLKHGSLEQLADNLWFVWGSLPNMSLKRNMVVVRLQSGELVLHNPIALDDASMKQLESLGDPALLVAPSGYHRLDSKVYKDRYPKAKVIAPRGSRKLVEEVLPVDLTMDEYSSVDPSVQFERLEGVDDKEGVMLVRSGDGLTLVFNDVIFNMDKKTDFLGYLFTTILGSAPGPRVSRLTKWTIIKDKSAVRAQLERYASREDLVRMIVAHEKVASGPDARAALRQAMTYL